jgi:hypothetical protein
MPVVTDVVARHGYSPDRDAPDPVDVVSSAAERVELKIPSVIAGIVDLLLAKAAEGRRVRAIIEDPMDGLSRSSVSTGSRSTPLPAARTSASNGPTSRCSSRSIASVSSASPLR